MMDDQKVSMRLISMLSIHAIHRLMKPHVFLIFPCTVSRISHPDWLVSSPHLVLFESLTLQGQSGIFLRLCIGKYIESSSDYLHNIHSNISYYPHFYLKLNAFYHVKLFTLLVKCKSRHNYFLWLFLFTRSINRNLDLKYLNGLFYGILQMFKCTVVLT